ncbi:MAG: iron ABC transporter permease [Chloroflexaceae bacterium]|nr:iron ABC transporter permease [Chloroflexaceae bacterium]
MASTPLRVIDTARQHAVLPWRGWALHGLSQRLLIVLLAGLVVLPLAVVALELLTPTADIWAHLWATVLPRMIRNTALLLVAVGTGTFVLGTGLAWLVTAYRFPGRNLFDWLLLLPLAMPSYILSFVFIATFDYAGPVQSLLRAWFGREVWFPNIYSGWSAALVMSLVLYPYVYLLARAAFREQCATTFDAARVMGYNRTQTFVRLVLPLARPSIVAGVTLAMMEALSDFATVRFFIFPTLSEGVFRVWEGMMNRQAAMELASLLFLAALAVVLVERGLRGKARYYQTGGRSRRFEAVRLHGWRGWLAMALCGAMLASAFVLPSIQLIIWTIDEFARDGAGGTLNVAFLRYSQTTLTLAGLAAAVAVGWSLLLAHSTRLTGGWLARVGVRLATLGYAMPGAVVAVGVLLTVSALDRQVGVWSGVLLTGTIVGLTYAYVTRFMAVSYGSVEASLDKVTPTMEQAARSLGASPRRVLWRIHLPLVSTGALTAATLVFVDVMKELPATLLLRPFGMDTLSIWAYLLAAEGFWEAAAVPSLSILGVGVVPVFLLMRLNSGGNQGE